MMTTQNDDHVDPFAAIQDGWRKERLEREAKAQAELDELNAKLTAAMRRAGVDAELVIAHWSKQEAWADASGYSVTGESDELAERGATWLIKVLEARGVRGGFSNVWGQSAPRNIVLYSVRDGVACVQTHYHMIGD